MGMGIIAQFAYYLAGFPWYEGNILFAFAVAAQVLTWCETRSGWRTAAVILLMALWDLCPAPVTALPGC